MQSILVDSLFTTSSPSPSNGRDENTQAVYTSWESGDEAGFSMTVSSGYVTGSDFSIIMEESSASVGMNHSWSITCLLRKQEAGESITTNETSIHQFVSASTVNLVTKRSMTVTGAISAGTVDNHSIQPGDYLTFIIRRSDATGDEDPLDIKVFSISVEYEEAQALLSDCPGRVGLIIETVRDLFNEPEADFLTDDFMLRSINRCVQDVAMEGYWRRNTWIPVSAGQDVIDLLSAIPDYVDVYQVVYGPQRWPLANLTSLKQLMRLKTLLDTPGTPEYYLIQNNKLMIVPAPTQDLSHGFLVYHSYCPPQLACAGQNSNPDTPKSHDQLFVYFTLCQAFLKDRAAPGADVKFHEYTTLYQNLKNRLLATATPVNAGLRPLR